jgi:methionine-rich copper-binding protein CopC
MPRRITRLPLIVLALAAALLAAVAPAAAAARPVVLRADPPDGATLERSPRQARVWLSQTVELRAGDVVLVDSAGHTTPVAGARAEAYLPASEGLAEHFDAKYLFLCSTSPIHRPSLLVVDLPALGAGTYQLVWNSMLLGGQEVALGSLVFRVDPVASGSAAVAVEAAAQPPVADRQAGDLLLNVALRPNQPGQNFLDLTVTNTRRPAPAPVAQVTVQIASEGDQGARATFLADELAEGRYRVAGLRLDGAGPWRITISVQRPGMADVTTIVPWEIANTQPAGRMPQLLSSRALAPLAVALLAGVLALILLRSKLVAPALARRVALRLWPDRGE